MATNQKQLRHLTDDESAFVTDGIRVFAVPVEFAPKIISAVPGLRFSFEHLGGRHVGHAKEKE